MEIQYSRDILSFPHTYVGTVRFVHPGFAFEKTKKGGLKNGVIGYTLNNSGGASEKYST